MRLKINNLADLENKIIGVLVAALGISFLGDVAGAAPPDALLDYGAGIAVVIAALAYFMRENIKGSGPPEDK